MSNERPQNNVTPAVSPPLRSGISSHHLELGASRLRQVMQYGLQAIVPNLPIVD